MRMKRAWLTLSAVCLTALTLAGCSGCPSRISQSDEPVFQRLSAQQCAALRLASDSAGPLESVEVLGWPEVAGADWGLVVARVIPLDGGDAPEELTVIADWRTPAALFVPLHPSENPEGGRVELIIGQIDYEGERTSCEQSLTFTIEPLPAADPETALDAYAAFVEEALNVASEAVGISLDQLQKMDASEVPEHLVPLYFAVRMLRDEDALPAIIAEISPNERRLLDRLFTQFHRLIPSGTQFGQWDPQAHSGTGGTADDIRARAFPVPDLTLVKTPIRQSQGKPNSPRTGLLWASPLYAQRSSTPEGDASPQEITFAELEKLLGLQLSGQAMLDGAGTLMDGAMLVLGLPVISRYGLLGQVYAWLNKLIAEYLAHTYPSLELRGPISLEVTHPEIWEDSEDSTGFVHVKSISFRISSRGWDPGPLMRQGMLMGMDRGFAALAKREMRLVFQHLKLDAATLFFLDSIVEGIVATPVIGSGVFVDLLERDGVLPPPEELWFPSETWLAVTRWPGGPHESVEVEFSEAITKDPSGRLKVEYMPDRFGRGAVEASWALDAYKHRISGAVAAQRMLGVEAEPWKPISFGVSMYEAVWVHPVEVSLEIELERPRVEPGDLVILSVTVDADHPLGFVQDSRGRLSEEVNTFKRIPYRIPADGDRGEIVFTAVSLSDRGVRNPSHPNYRGEVAASATLFYGSEDVVIDSAPVCVERGESVQLWAVATAAEDRDVTWSVTEGPARIDQEGVLTATGSGTVRVRAAIRDEPEVWDEREFEAGECVCLFAANLSGDTGKSLVQGRVAHFSTEGRATVMGAFTNPSFLEDMMSWGLGGGRLDDDDQVRIGDRHPLPDEWRREMEAMPSETLGISLVAMDPSAGESQLLAAMGGGFSLMASVVDHPIEPGFSGLLSLAHLTLVTGEYTGDGYPMKFEWSPGEPGNALLIVDRYDGGRLSGRIEGTIIAPGLYDEVTGAPPEIELAIRFHAREYDPMNLRMGCTNVD
jgi:hypothetical protein